MTFSGLDKKAQLSRGTGEREDEDRAADSHLEPDFGVGSAERLGVLSDTAFERFEELCRFHTYRLATGQEFHDANTAFTAPHVWPQTTEVYEGDRPVRAELGQRLYAP
jgi:hypothetical protein